MTNYNDSLDRTASDIRDELTNRIREAVNSNQECFIAHWLLQNPDADLTNITLCHGFKGNSYTFWGTGERGMNQQAFEQFFQKPEGFIYSEQMGLYFEHTDYRFKYPLEAIGNFNLKWQGWVAAQQVAQTEQGHTYTGTGSDHLDCVLGVGGFEQYGPIGEDK